MFLQELATLLGIDLAVHAERIGNRMLVIPETRVAMRVKPSKTQTHVGVEIIAVDGGPAEFLLGIECERIADGAEFRAVHQIGPGLHVFPCAADANRQVITLYDRITGGPLAVDGGVALREVITNMQLVTTGVHLNVELPDRSTVHVQTEWGTTESIHIGSRHHFPWEASAERAAREREWTRARTSGTQRLYAGSAVDRARAVDDIRGILRNSNGGVIRIWDRYFGTREIFEFLFYVFDPKVEIRLLTSLDGVSVPAPEPVTTFAGACEFENPPGYREAHLRRTLSLARNLGGRASGLTNLRIRLCSHSSHDRFIITKERAWQLGSSLNSIGQKISTLIALSDPPSVRAEFDREWEESSDL
jgi:hypothetical protein